MIAKEGYEGKLFDSLVYYSFLAISLGNAIFPTVEQLDDLYTGLVSGVLGNLGRGKTPEIIDELSTVNAEDRHTIDSYMKLYYSLTMDYGSHAISREEFFGKNPESDNWVIWVESAFEQEEIYRSNPEKWLLNLRNKIIKKMTKTHQADHLKDLYSYIFWFNHHQNLWYAITRETEITFFSGDKLKAVYFSDENINHLIETVANQPKVG